jgi:hypothetical protein
MSADESNAAPALEAWRSLASSAGNAYVSGRLRAGHAVQTEAPGSEHVIGRLPLKGRLVVLQGSLLEKREPGTLDCACLAMPAFKVVSASR